MQRPACLFPVGGCTPSCPVFWPVWFVPAAASCFVARAYQQLIEFEEMRVSSGSSGGSGSGGSGRSHVAVVVVVMAVVVVVVVVVVY